MMRQILTGRYDSVDGYAGWVEGVRDDGSKWIMYIDENGSPTEFYGERDESGAIVGEPIDLAQYDD
jgi:hypothetical protein